MKIKLTAQAKTRDGIQILLRTADGGRADVPPKFVIPEAAGKTVTVNRDLASGRLVAVHSLGKKADVFSDSYRRAGGAIAAWMADQSLTDVVLDVETAPNVSIADAIRGVAEGLLLRDYRFDEHKSAPEKRPALKVSIRVHRVTPALQRLVQDAECVCAAVNTARDLAHQPPNVVNPVTLARRVQVLARRFGLRCTVLDERQMAKAKMGGILAVGQGSATPPRLIVLEYAGRGPSSRRTPPVVLVGKAITFDTGGYSLKTKEGILGMKYDKCGGMAVLGALQAAAACKLRTPVVGILAAAENMVAGNAYRPDDIIRTMSGKTVQIVSADAEGRMVLCDALTYAQKRYKPRAVIDVATLTGGVVVALGNEAAGIMSNNDALQNALIEAGRRTFERLWPLPLWDEYFELLRGDDSDFKNSAGREAHAIQGGIFLKQFVDAGVPWAHLDIAGVDSVQADRPYCPKGATGFGVRLLVDYLARL